LAVHSQIRQSAKLNSPPNFPAIRYSKLGIRMRIRCLMRSTWNGEARSAGEPDDAVLSSAYPFTSQRAR